jgi:tetratricopeptide (TPR) repeat protein
MFINKTPRGARTALLTILFLIAVAVPAVFAKSKDMPLTANKAALALFVQARSKADNLENAGTMFDDAVQADPNFAFGYLFAGQNNLDFQRNLATAVRLADKASPGEREWIFATRDANNADRVGQLAHLEELLRLFPNDKRAHMQMAVYYRNTGDTATALQHLQDAVKIDKKFAPAYNLIGYSYMDIGKYADAEAAFRTYIKLIPNNANPYDSYAEFLMKIGKYDESIKQYNLALEKDPTFVNSYQGMGDNYGYKGDYAKSREIYQTMFAKATTEALRDQALTSTMNSWIAEGNTAKALQVNEDRIVKAGKDGDIATLINLHHVSSFICGEAGDAKCAQMHFDMAGKLADDPSLRAELKENRRFNARQQQVRIMTAEGDYDGARTELAAMGLFASTHPAFDRQYNVNAGNLALAEKNYAKANEFYSKANSQDPYVWYNSAVAYEGAGDTKSAMNLYRQIADWNQLDTTGYALVRARAVAKVKM